MPAADSKLADPEWRRERARKASAAAHSLDTYVKRVVARAGELTPEQAAQLRALLPPPPAGGVRQRAS